MSENLGFGIHQIVFRLYINTRSSGAAEIIERINTLFKKNFSNGYVLEIIDIIKNYNKALNDDVLASPTLIKIQPEPKVRIVGNLVYDQLIDDLKMSK